MSLKLACTYFSLPRDPNQSAAWLKALATAGSRICKSLVVCSEHFLPEEFDGTRPNQRRVKHGVVPTLLLPLNQEEFMVCRVCLALDVKMYNLRELKLSEMFQNITGISVIDKTESTLHRVCWECATRLTAASAFRDKALLSDALLKDLVHINKREIEQLKQYYRQLKSTLTIQTVFTSDDIDCGDSFPENELHSPTKRKIYERKTRLTNNKEEEIDLHEEEPLIGAPVKTEVEFDPIVENVRIKDEKSETFSELSNFDDSFPASKEHCVSELTITEERMDNNQKNEDIEMSNAPIKDKIYLVEDSAKKPQLDVVENEPTSKDAEMPIEANDDSDIVLAEDNVEENRTLDDIGEISSGEDTQSLAELASVKKAKKKTRRKVGSSNIIPANSCHPLSEDLRQRIIKHKLAGLGIRETARLLGIARNTVRLWLRRWHSEGNLNAHKPGGGMGQNKKTTDEEDQLILDRVSQSPVHTRSLAKEFGISHDYFTRDSRKLSQITAGLINVLFQTFRVDENLKERIMIMKQNGVGVTDMAKEFEVPRTTIYQWWRRWCKENNIETSKDYGNDNTEKGPKKIVPRRTKKWKKIQPDVDIES